MSGRHKEVIYKLTLSQFEPGCPWRILRIADAADILGGGTPDTAVEEFWSPPEIPWATPTDITATDGNEVRTTARQISKAGLKQSTLVPENAILMTSRATIGAAKINRVPMAINQGFAALVPKEGYVTEYLFHLIDVLKPILVRLGAGTTFLETSRREIKKIEVKLPDECEQRYITAALKLADEAIAKARAELEATLDLKASLLRFVFRQGISAPNGLRESRWIACPSHWDIKPLKTFAKVASGFTMGRDLARFETVEVPYVTVVNVQEGRFDLSALGSIQIKQAEIETDLLEHGDILMTEGGDRDKLGRGGMWRADLAPCSYQNHIFRVRLDRRVYKPELFHYLIQTFQAKNYFYAHAKQTSNLCTINSRELKNWPVPIPPMNEQEKMIKVLDAIEKQHSAIERQVSALQDLKKSLLQNLLTGKIRLPEGVIHG